MKEHKKQAYDHNGLPQIINASTENRENLLLRFYLILFRTMPKTKQFIISNEKIN